MNIKEWMLKQPTLYILGTLLIGFCAGIGTYEAILRIAKLEVVSKAESDKLRENMKISVGHGSLNLKKVEITDPIDNIPVENKITIKGTSQNISGEESIWILVYVKGDRYYPLDKPADIDINGNWSSFATLGIKKDEKYSLIAVVADKTVQNKFNIYNKRVKETHTYPGIERLPKNAKIHHRITVIGK